MDELSQTSKQSLVAKRLLQVLASILIQAAILFISSGRLDWMMAWAFTGVYVIILAVNAFWILPKNSDLIAERAQLKKDTKPWDRAIINIVSATWLATLFVAALDFRFGWSSGFAFEIQLVGLVLVTVGYGLASWAMASNKFFARGVRIQSDRGHTVATGGPYRFVRHPGYLGMMIYSLATPISLGSLWALIPALATACIFIVRTALEDNTLLSELEGYSHYAQRVHYRLIPCLW